MSLQDIVNVSISRETAGITQAGFGTALILGPNAPAGMSTYTSLAAVAEDFETTDPEYKMAAKIFGQTPRVASIKTYPAVPVVQVVTFTPDVTSQSIQVFSVTIDGVDFDFTSDASPTAAEVVTGLKALIDADTATAAKVTTSGTTTLIVTEDVTGAGFTYESSANLTGVKTGTSMPDILQDAIDADNDFYFILMTSDTPAIIKAMAATVEGLSKIFLFRTDEAAGRTSATTDLLSVLKAAAYYRTGGFYTGTPGDYADAAFCGRLAPLDPGSESWAFKTLAGVTVDTWTDSEKGYLNTKNANYYVNLAGVNVTMNGKAAGGEFLDVMRFIDWLTARIQEEIFGHLARSNKVPCTDAGIAVVEAAIRAVLERGVAAGGVASSQDYTVTVPKSAAVSSNDKAARRLTGVKFTARLAGAVHAVEISGNVTL